METKSRTWAKALSWQATGIVVTCLIGYYYTGSMATAFSLASISSVSGLLMYVLHEKVWQKVRWGKTYA